MRIGRTRFNPWVIGTVALLSIAAVATLWALRTVLVEVPGAAFALLLTFLVVGVLLAGLVKRWADKAT
ncbi:MAG: hypothetical protein R3185_03280 [Candidatus Thermoplasmatota archaeon]|nr:hypothetical protein [Candidatus Thermoplasmatota archaeon]